MLYTEFLAGTFELDNKWTYKEYKRIEAIYNDNEGMTKEDAYKLFIKPDDFTFELLEDIATEKADKINYKINADIYYKAMKDIEAELEAIKELHKQAAADVRYTRYINNILADL